MTDTVVVGQTLHGYAHGHRLLAASLDLDASDARYVLSASDLGESSQPLSEAGYISGYPLPKSGVFAIGRTWPAKEITRPGCVWTHTLYIRFPDLAKVVSATEIFSLFLRPEVSGFERYESSMHLSSSDLVRPAMGGSHFEFDAALTALYCTPDVPARVCWREHGNADERVQLAALELWVQQWPRLRRAIRFCSWASSQASSDGIDLALFVGKTSANHMLKSIPSATEFATTSERWRSVALNDLMNPLAKSPLRSFLMEVGADSTSGRAAFAPLCTIFSHIGGADITGSDLSASINVLQSAFPKDDVTALRKLLCREILNQIEAVELDCLEFLIGNLEFMPAELTAVDRIRFGEAIWRARPELLFQTSELGEIARQSLQHLQLHDLVSGIRAEPKLLLNVFEYRPDILDEPAFWTGLENNELHFILKTFSNARVEVPWKRAALAALSTGDERLLESLVKRISQRDALYICLSQMRGPNSKSSAVRALWNAATIGPSELAWFLANVPDLDERFLVTIARHTQPDFVLNEYGNEPWLNACNSRPPQSEFLLCYLMSRALGQCSRNSLGLFRLAFEPLYNLAAGPRDLDGWQLLKNRLPVPWPWFEWDRCQRLRAAAVELFTSGRADRKAFLTSIEDETIFWDVCEQATDTWAGRDLLRSVARDKGSDHVERRRALALKFRGL